MTSLLVRTLADTPLGKYCIATIDHYSIAVNALSLLKNGGMVSTNGTANSYLIIRVRGKA